MAYSQTIQWILFSAWAIGSLVMAWFVRRRFYVYMGSVTLSVPGLVYSTLGYGLLEMGGVFHALCAGLYVLPFHCFFQRCRSKFNYHGIEFPIYLSRSSSPIDICIGTTTTNLDPGQGHFCGPEAH